MPGCDGRAALSEFVFMPGKPPVVLLQEVGLSEGA